VFELAGAQLSPEYVLGGGAGVLAYERIDDALLSSLLRARLHVLALALPRQSDRNLDKVAHDLLDVAADIAHLGKLGRLHLEERPTRELGEAARNLGLADAGRPDHQDVLGQHLLAQPVVELEAAPAIAQRDRDRALGVALADDVAVELGDDLAGREFGHALRTMRRERTSGVSTSCALWKPAFS